MPKRVLTGIKPTGTPHVGNLLGAIRPALRLADEGLEAMYFIADYHALTQLKDRAELARYSHEVAATWLACGLDPERVLFYRQSDLPETFELAWVLACFTTKGWMDLAHAYKAAVAAGEADTVNIGTYTYPVLMAADILLFDSDYVPVGKDQVQHIEIARDIAQRVNSTAGEEVLKLPQARIEDNTATVPGIDGRKMSKSYGNTIPLFVSEKERKKLIGRIVTDSKAPEEPAAPAGTIFEIYKAVASAEETQALADRYRAGIGWGDAKKALHERLERELAGPRERYNELMADTAKIDRILADGAARARPIARATVDRVRRAVGIGA